MLIYKCKHNYLFGTFSLLFKKKIIDIFINVLNMDRTGAY